MLSRPDEGADIVITGKSKYVKKNKGSFQQDNKIHENFIRKMQDNSDWKFNHRVSPETEWNKRYRNFWADKTHSYDGPQATRFIKGAQTWSSNEI